MDANMVIFDLDGTLIDTIGDLAAAVEHALSQGGFPGHTVGEYRNMVGHGIRNLVTRALPEGSPDDVIDVTLERFVEYYIEHIDVLSRPYPGIPELLGTLVSEGFTLAVASNKFQEGTESLIRRFFPEIPFVKILGNAPGLPLKPDPEVIRLAIAAACHSLNEAGSPPGQRPYSAASHALNEAGVATGQRPYSAAAKREWTRPRPGGDPVTPATAAVMVGDSATDIKTARNAGIPAIAVSWGFRPRADLEIADAIADTPEQLGDFIRIFAGKN